jgi:hypothetical protein
MATIEKSVEINLICDNVAELIERLSVPDVDLTRAKLYISYSDEWGFEAELCYEYDETPEEEAKRLRLERIRAGEAHIRRIKQAKQKLADAERQLKDFKEGKIPF